MRAKYFNWLLFRKIGLFESQERRRQLIALVGSCAAVWNRHLHGVDKDHEAVWGSGKSASEIPAEA